MSKLAIGVAIDSIEELSNWEAKLLADILADSRLELRDIVENRSPAKTAAPLALRLLQRGEQMVFARNTSSLAREVKSQLLRITADKGSAYSGVDIFIRLTADALPRRVLDRTRLGELSLDFVDRKTAGYDWAGFREVRNGSPFTKVVVNFRASASEPPQPLAGASYGTKFCATVNGAFLKEKSVILLMRELRRIADSGELKPAAAVQPTEATHSPSYRDLPPYLRRLAGNILTKALVVGRTRLGLKARSWGVHIGSGSIEDFRPSESLELQLAPGMWAADPFLFQWNGEDYVFFECFPGNHENAWLSVAKLVDGKAELLGTCLRTSYHLSYPFVFNDGDDIYLIPETHQTGRVEIWKSVEFPLKWELHATALEGQSPADTVMFKTKGQWWLLTSLSDHSDFMDHCSELYAFAVDGPALTSVVPHKRNPVIIGSDIARNAGRVHLVGDRLLRPSQCNSHGVYGYGLNIQEITRLDADEYSERPLRLIEPNFKPGIVACHHVDFLGGRFVIDLCRA
ncbi:hypothetical protein OSJ77_07120 [Phyllobacterium sp. 0TCS1.6C]|uniref:glucosamine inositolphosphorylceramide transferase family protein n=1 Tax=unclassified Phyllobacterium TaxID=2638441 RepID=UPI002264BC3B|nr:MULTISPECIES: hypothetical protein [unclassified Phyllobacterium]MCX8279953.1 hypothetical protein [Phyllobacterium sp. 0TCS1.6C]MCX8296120.1 hypothetical protein [Phyllobacterium sp. 0TCS1.6A]